MEAEDRRRVSSENTLERIIPALRNSQFCKATVSGVSKTADIHSNSRNNVDRSTLSLAFSWYLGNFEDNNTSNENCAVCKKSFELVHNPPERQLNKEKKKKSVRIFFT